MATENAAAQGAEAAHGSGGLPQLDFTTWPSQIFWLVVALVVLYYLMSKIALPRISETLEERADAIADDLDKADEFRRRAAEAEKAYDQALADARARAQAIAAEARAEIQAELDAALAEADAEISARTAESEKRIRAIRDDAAAAVESVATETAGALIDALLPEAQDRKAVASAVRARV